MRITASEASKIAWDARLNDIYGTIEKMAREGYWYAHFTLNQKTNKWDLLKESLSRHGFRVKDYDDNGFVVYWGENQDV